MSFSFLPINLLLIFFAHYTPKYILAPQDEFDGAGGNLKKLTTSHWHNGLGHAIINRLHLYWMLDTTDANDPLILAKADVWSMKLGNEKKKTRKMRSPSDKKRKTRSQLKA